MSTPEKRAEIAGALRAEAYQLLQGTGLFALLQSRFGEAIVTGSASYDLMVRRQIDIHLPVDAERLPEWIGLLGTIAEQMQADGLELQSARFRNDYLVPGPLGSALCWGLEFKTADGNPWTIDIRGLEPFDFAVRQARDFSLRTDLELSDRDLILRLKTEAIKRPSYYGSIVTGYSIYQFVIAKAGESLAALEASGKVR